MHILHLEDDGPLREVLKLALTSVEPELTMQQFTNADFALDYVADHLDEIDLYILDIRVPGKLDGLAFAEQLRKMGAIRPIVITSAYQKPNTNWLTSVQCEWMSKPWHILNAAQKIIPLARGDNIPGAASPLAD